ncbi:uncharacterized protein TRAVEDRAFT_74492 [Trametes versicolor FP-101664 SS1]|uniref:uncharacterized protein n=1 Tax=Trametes versicolor (strain FP-101664) TaxID=717944 RepID=UPI000462247A|nr:uncharacterized protein TRAVEDRAFT_74492 [Trametes versicolor FP-101664 SS1]EIW54424.1 hypothetical protein TRAVEDRAFT_74492 [Trametes versicolor FP-101664 SS1]
MSATPTNPPPFWQPRPADFQIPAADQHNHAPQGQSGGPPPWARPYQPKGYPPHQGYPENRRDEPSPPTLDPRAPGFKPRGDRKGPASSRSETTSNAPADVDINRYLQDRPPGLPSPDLGTKGHASGHLPPQGDAALELLALWEEPEEKWLMGADTDGGSSRRAKTSSKTQSVAENAKRESTEGVKSGLVESSSTAASKEIAGQPLLARVPTPLVDTSEVPSPITSSAIPGVRDGTESSACDGSLDKDFPRSPQLEVCAPQGVPADKARLLSLSELDSLAPVEGQIGDSTLPTARTASPTTSVSTAGGTRTSDESLADYPVLTPTPTALSFSPVTVTAYSSRASESTPDLDDDRSYATSAASAYTPGRSVTSVERRAGPIGQQLREARIDRLEARIEVLAADLEILRLELAQLRGE